MTLYSSKESNIRKTWLIFSLFFAVIIGLGWAISYIYNDPGILYLAVLFSICMNVIAYWNSDSIVLRMNKAQKADPAIFRELHALTENLCIATGLQKPALYVINDPSPNAFATGRNPEHAALAVTTGLLSRLEKKELEGVVAHELSHIKNYDTLLQTVVVILVGFISIAADMFLRSMWFGGSRDNDENRGGNPIFMIIGIVFIVLSPIASTLIQLAISRKREFLADATGALMTRYPEGLASALEKIASATPLKSSKNATAHLYFVNPFKADVSKHTKTPLLAKLFMTHPPIEERVAALRHNA